VAGRSYGLLWSVQGLDGCDRHQILHGTGELLVEGDQRVGMKLGQGDVLGVKVSGHPSRTAAFHATFWRTRSPSSRIRSLRT
jgi:hypothetical protein